MDISYIKQMLILKIYMGERKGEGVRPKGGGETRGVQNMKLRYKQ